MRRLYTLPCFTLVCTALASAQSAPTLAGDWEGTLDAISMKLRLALHVTKTADGLYLGKIDSLDQHSEIPMKTAVVNGRSVTLEFPSVEGTFKGELSVDNSRLSGTWAQGLPLPLTLKRVGSAPAEMSTTAPAAAAEPGEFGLDVTVPVPPTPVRGAGGRTNLIYELHITNFTLLQQSLTRIEILGDTSSLATFEGKPLVDILDRIGSHDVLDPRQMPAGSRTVAFLLVSLADGNGPKKLRHKITAGGTVAEVAPVAVAEAKPIVIAPPLRGPNWVAGNGPGDGSNHRRSLMPVGGRAVIAQRFAIDWVRIRVGEATFQGDEKDNKSYAAYGAEALAVADATVAAVKDGIPENVPAETARAVPMTLETATGNHVVLDLGGGRFCLYAHLQPGSLKVKTGDRVRRGQVLGLVGNSGNSTEPHLHFHVMDGPSPLGSEGLPYLIDSFELMSGRNRGAKTNALPMENMIVTFAK